MATAVAGKAPWPRSASSRIHATEATPAADGKCGRQRDRDDAWTLCLRYPHSYKYSLPEKGSERMSRVATLRNPLPSRTFGLLGRYQKARPSTSIKKVFSRGMFRTRQSHFTAGFGSGTESSKRRAGINQHFPIVLVGPVWTTQDVGYQAGPQQAGVLQSGGFVLSCRHRFRQRAG